MKKPIEPIFNLKKPIKPEEPSKYIEEIVWRNPSLIDTLIDLNSSEEEQIEEIVDIISNYEYTSDFYIKDFYIKRRMDEDLYINYKKSSLKEIKDFIYQVDCGQKIYNIAEILNKTQYPINELILKVEPLDDEYTYLSLIRKYKNALYEKDIAIYNKKLADYKAKTKEYNKKKKEFRKIKSKYNLDNKKYKSWKQRRIEELEKAGKL